MIAPSLLRSHRSDGRSTIQPGYHDFEHRRRVRLPIIESSGMSESKEFAFALPSRGTQELLPGESLRIHSAAAQQIAVFSEVTVFEPIFNHSFGSRAFAWFHPAYVWTRRGDVGTTRSTVRFRQAPPPNQSKYRSTSLEHHPPDYRSTPKTQRVESSCWPHLKKEESTHAQDDRNGNGRRMEVRRG